MSYDNSRQMIITKAEQTSSTSPALRINFEVDGQRYKCSLWVWTTKAGQFVLDKKGNKQYIGNYEEDNWTPDTPKAKPAKEKVSTFSTHLEIDDQDIPF